MANPKFTDLTATTTPASTDIMPIIVTPGTTPTGKKITLATLLTFFFPTLSSGKYLTNNGSTMSWGDVTTAPTKGTFVNGDLSTGVLTITHNLGLSAPYGVILVVFNNSNVQVIPDTITGAADSVAVSLVSYGVLTGTWQYVYWKA